MWRTNRGTPQPPAAPDRAPLDTPQGTTERRLACAASSTYVSRGGGSAPPAATSPSTSLRAVPADRSSSPRAPRDPGRTTSTRPRHEVPRPERPRRLRRSGGTWTSEQIVEAMRAWTDEVGVPPRTYDWAPAIARVGGFPTAGAREGGSRHPPRAPPPPLHRRL